MKYSHCTQLSIAFIIYSVHARASECLQCTGLLQYPDVLLYILLFLLCRVARILKRFVTRHERIDALVSVVLCLPAHLRVSRSVPWPAPHGNASKAFHRRGVTQSSRATRGYQPRAARRRSQLAAQRSGSQRSAAARSATQRQRRVRHGASSAVQSIALTAPRP